MSIADKAQAHALLIEGQEVPTSATRAVHDPATGEPFAEVLLHKVDRLVVGDPMDDATNLGPLVSLQQRELTGAPRKEWYDAVSSPE